MSIVVAFGALAAAASPPNLILFLADDMGWGDLAVYGGAVWAQLRAKLARQDRARPALYRMCGDVTKVSSDVVGSSSYTSTKYAFSRTGGWWRGKMAAAAAAEPAAHTTPLFRDSAGGGAGGGAGGETAAAVHVAVHIRRGDMVFRNFYKQLSPDTYFVNAMWHVLTAVRRRAAAQASGGGAAAAPRVVFHVFSQRPPAGSWAGSSEVPRDSSGAEYVDELGCASSLAEQLAALAGGRSDWAVRMHLDVDPVQTLLHMASASALIASDSSFSLVAGVLSRGLVISRRGWRRFPPDARAGILHSVLADDDGRFACDEALAHWAASAPARAADAAA
jgi:hypothetical protein